MYLDRTSGKLVAWLQESVKQAKAEGAVFGMSGGLDSSVVSLLCKKAFGKKTLGLIMPCYSDPRDEKDARELAKTFGIEHKVINLDNIYDQMLAIIDPSDNVVLKANIKPRLRMTVLYYYAGLYNYLVIGSENKSEIMVGYFTKQCGSDLLPLGGLVKSEVKKLASYLGVSQTIINKAPSAGLWQGQTDEKEMGISYEELDNYVLTGQTADPDVTQKIEALKQRSNHKRKLPPIPSLF